MLIATICTSLCGGILSCYFLTKLSWNNEQYNFNTIQYTQTEIQQIIDNIVVSAYQMGLDPLVEKYLRPILRWIIWRSAISHVLFTIHIPRSLTM